MTSEGGADLAALTAAMASSAAAVERELEELLRPLPGVPEPLLAAMRHGVLGGGKRLRPYLVQLAAGLGQAEPAAVRRAGAAIELVHCYSLIHDDLPAMDDASLRRGKPSVHKAFGEATAILAGDALVALAFEALARDDWPVGPTLRCRLIRALSRAAGAGGMCGGQALDLASGQGAMDEPGLVQLQALKTGAIIAVALDAGGLLAEVSPSNTAAVRTYAAALGLAFQIKDDLLDEKGEAAQTGKEAGRDRALGRATFVTRLGVAGAEARLAQLHAAGIGALTELGEDKARPLVDLFAYVANRSA